MSEKVTLVFKVNGAKHEILITPDESLLSVLRDRLGLKGSKKGCEEGECGACTVLIEGRPMLSCLTPALKCSDLNILTVEGLASEGRLSPLQEAFVEAGAVQCGYCTPGMLMSAEALLSENHDPTEAEIAQALSGNLCRCTGYVKIIEAVRLAVQKRKDLGV